MTQKVEVILDGKEAGIVRAWKNARDSVAAYEGQLGKVDAAQQRGAKSSQQWDAQLSNLGRTVTGMAAGWASVDAVVGAVADEVQRYRDAITDAVRESEEAFSRLDRRKRRLQVTTGQGPLATEQMQRELFGVAQETATPTRDVTEVALGLSSSGADQKDLIGGTRSISSFINAQALGEGANYEQLTDAITSMILGQGKALTEKSIESLTSQLQSQSVKETKFKVPDLAYWAKEAQGLKKFGKMEQEDIVALAAVTRNAVNPSSGATMVRELMKNLSIAGGKKDATDALKSMHMKPEQIDMVGESWMEAFMALREGLNTLPEDKRQIALTKIAEGANVGEFYGITDSMQQIKDVKEGLQKSDLTKDAAIFSEGPNAGAIRLQNEKEKQDAELGAYPDIYRKALENTLNENKASKPYIKRRLDQYDTGIKQGFDPETSAKYEHGSGKFNLFDPIINEMLEDPKYRDKIAEETRKKFESAVGGPDSADAIRHGYTGWRPGIAPAERPPGDDIRTPEQAEMKGREANSRRNEAIAAGDTASAEMWRQQYEVLVEIHRTLTNQKPPSVSIAAAGGGAPAKPVAAAGIGANSR